MSSRPFSLLILVISEDTLTERASNFSLLPRLHSSSIQRSSSTASHRHSTSNGLPQKSPLNLNANVTTRINASAPESVNSVSGFIKQGASIIDRIGEPDHTGWMRKRGDKNNSWKSLYFILKGPHLYFLRRNDESVSCALLGF